MRYHHLELKEHIEPTASPPSQDEKEEWTTWYKDDRRAMRTIGGHLSSINVAKIAECKTALEVWTLLQSQYCIQGSVGNFHIWTRLRTTLLEGNSDLAATQAYLDQHRKLCSQPAARITGLSRMTSLQCLSCLVSHLLGRLGSRHQPVTIIS
jgi:hypothetical protein